MKISVTSVRNRFGVSPDEVIITGGVLSPNANESHLTGRQKSAEELAQDVNTAYGINLETPLENTSGGMKR